MRNRINDRGRRALRLVLALALAASLLASALGEDANELLADPVQEQIAELEELELMAPAGDAAEDIEAKAAPTSTVAPTIEVVEAQPKAASVPKKLTLGVKETYTLKVSGAKKYATSDKKVATVSKKGVVTAKKKGAATITVTNKKGKTTKVKVTVKKAPGEVTVKPKALTLEVGQTYKLTAKLPSKTASNKLTWKSKNKAVATVGSDGTVTAVAPGKVKITVKTFNKKTAACALTVVAPAATPEPTAEPTPKPTAEPTPTPNPASELVQKYEAAVGMTNEELEAASGMTIEALNQKSVRDLTELAQVTDGVAWRMANDDWDGVVLTGCDGAPSSLTIHASYGNDLPVREMRQGAFSRNEALEKVVVEEGVAELPFYAFDTCVNLGDITLPDTLTKVGFHAFYRVGESLPEPFYLELPDGIVEQSFSECNAVLVCRKDSTTAHTLSDGSLDFTCPGEYDFRYRYMEYTTENSWVAKEDGVWGSQLALRQYVGDGGAVEIPKGAVYILDGAFRGKTGITSVTIPEGVVRICYDAFNGCTGIESVKFPSTLRSIQNKAFYGVEKAKYFDLPDNLTGISGNGGGAHSFEGCTAVLRVKKGSDTAHLLSAEKNYDVTFPGEEDFRYRYVKIDGADGAEYRLYLWGYVGQSEEVVIPAGIYGVSRIPPGGSDTWSSAFYGNKTLKKVVIPEGAVVVEDSAFNGCTMLADITLPSTLKILKNHAFQNTGTAAAKRFIVVLPESLEKMTYQNWGAGWDSFQDSAATLVALNAYTRKALYDGWYYFYESLADAQNQANIIFQPTDDEDFVYHGAR